MPPYSETRMAPILQDEEVALSAKARERDLLAIIANKDKRIQQLEQKLEAQSAFIEAVLKLSDHYKTISSNNSKSKGNRRVSWCEDIEQALVPPPSNTDQIGVGQIVDVDEDDDVSVLSEDGENKAVDVDSIGASVRKDSKEVFDDVRINATNRMAISKLKAMENVGNAENENGEVDLDAIMAARTKAKKQSSTCSSAVVDIDEIAASKAKDCAKKFEEDEENLEPTKTVQKKVKPSKLERKLIQSIIEKIRNDDDSVDV